ncbi:hypothetical protein [Rhizobacter sp. Root404]|uniref:hypothetical protein n=1 Tax=Rhizobacter sp. Root404 TaxID=1736528 RepID=UPI0012FB23A6|nr:hypothetical protein [Rhizobacter sp. Root404]
MYTAKRRQGLGAEDNGDPLMRATHSQVSRQRPRSLHEGAQFEQEQRQSDLRDANESLVLAALGAQDLLAAAEEARRRQAELLALVADELSNPYAPIRVAAATLGFPGAESTLLPRVRVVIEKQAERLAGMVRAVLDQSS